MIKNSPHYPTEPIGHLHYKNSQSLPTKQSQLVSQQPSGSFLIKKRKRQKLAEVGLHNIMNINSQSDIVTKIRRNKIVVDFINRLKLNTVRLKSAKIQKTLDQLDDECQSVKNIFSQQTLHIYQKQFQILTIFMKLILLLFSYFFLSVQLVLDGKQLIDNLSITLVFCYEFVNVAELIWYAFRINSQNQQENTIKCIIHSLAKKGKINDIILPILTIFSFITQNKLSQSLTVLTIIWKLLQLGAQMQKKQLHLINSYLIHKYWDIIKILLFNIVIAHTISLILNFAAQQSLLHYDMSWYSLKSMNVNSCGQKYLWGFYWAISIMFTIGFGDINATTSIQAFTVIAVSVCSCLVLAYNISEINQILQKINLKGEELKSRLSEFNKISKRYSMDRPVKTYFQKYIQKQMQDKMQYDYAQQQKLIKALPQKLQVDFKRQINKNIFSQLFFFKQLTKKTQYLLAQNLVNKVAHPEEIFMHKNQKWKIHILRLGQLKLCYRRGNSKLNGSIIQKFRVEDGQPSQLLSLKFLKNHLLEGDLIAGVRSIISELTIQNFQNYLKKSNVLMHEYYCQLRDTNQQYLFNYGTHQCPICQNLNHNKFDCPKLHYFPLKHFLAYRCLIRGNLFKQKRTETHRSDHRFCPLQSPILRQEDVDEHMGFKLKFIKMFNRSIARENNIEEISMHSFCDQYSNSIYNKLQKFQKKLGEIIYLLQNDESYYKKRTIECDLAHNFRKYYPEFNPSELNKIKVSQQNMKTSIKEETCTIRKSNSFNIPTLKYMQFNANIY